MIKKNLHYLLLLFIIANISFSFYRYFHTALDGDVAAIVVPSADYKQVLSDPLGIAALKNEIYSSPNRFFANWTMSKYFKTMPLFLQHFTNPIDSIYLSCALIKIAILALIIYLLASLISSTGNPFKKEFLLAAAFITPLFQTAGFNYFMGIIDLSITYNFFYALPLALLLLFFAPFYKAEYYNKPLSFNILQKILWLVLIPVLSLSGPLIPPIVLIACPLVLLNKWIHHYNELKEKSFFSRVYFSLTKIPGEILFYFVLSILFSLYSVYIGRNNAENFTHLVPLGKRFHLLPRGIFYTIRNPGVILFLLMITVNVIIIRRGYLNSEGRRTLLLLKWIAIFSAIYILLLPLGGFRDYRPHIVRYDTIMPVTILLIFIWGSTTFFIASHLKNAQRIFYITGLVICLSVFVCNDLETFNDNFCEKESLVVIAQSPEKYVELNNDCNIMSWGKTTDYGLSKTNTQLLLYWRVINTEKFYKQK